MRGDIEPYELRDAVETWLARLPEREFKSLVYRVRPPDEPLIDSSKGRV
jgi:hypothetical protein